MKTYRPWVLAVVLALPAVVSAAEPTSTPCTASASASGADIEMADLIDRVAKRTGKQFIIDPRVRAQVSSAGLDFEKVDYRSCSPSSAIHQFAAYESNGVVESPARRECAAIADPGHQRGPGESTRRRIRDRDVPGEEHVHGACGARTASAHAASRSPRGVTAGQHAVDIRSRGAMRAASSTWPSVSTGGARAARSALRNLPPPRATASS